MALCSLDQVVAHVGVGNADKQFRPFPGGFTLQVDHAVFRNNILHDRPGNRHDGAGRKVGTIRDFISPFLFFFVAVRQTKAFPPLE